MCPLPGTTPWPLVLPALISDTCHPVMSLAQNEILWFELESKTQLLTRNALCHALITYLNHRKLLSLSVGGEKKILILKYPRDVVCAVLREDMNKHFLERHA